MYSATADAYIQPTSPTTLQYATTPILTTYNAYHHQH